MKLKIICFATLAVLFMGCGHGPIAWSPVVVNVELPLSSLPAIQPYPYKVAYLTSKEHFNVAITRWGLVENMTNIYRTLPSCYGRLLSHHFEKVDFYQEDQPFLREDYDLLTRMSIEQIEKRLGGWRVHDIVFTFTFITPSGKQVMTRKIREGLKDLQELYREPDMIVRAFLQFSEELGKAEELKNFKPAP
ncbi:MAG: hypothetical protein KBG09_03170 [Syntrophobacterales bacterium]|nr:hypothetical protein [Syntrophobacterales bacterium]